SVRRRHDHEDGDRQCVEVLFVLHPLVYGDQDIKARCRRSRQETSVAQRLPAQFSRRLDVVRGETFLEPARQAMVEKDVHPGTRSENSFERDSSSTAMAWLRVTPGKSPRNSSRLSPPSR